MSQSTHITVGRNKVNLSKVTWHRMYSTADNRIVGVAGDFRFAAHPHNNERLTTFNPHNANDAEYLNKYTFVPITNSIKLVDYV